MEDNPGRNNSDARAHAESSLYGLYEEYYGKITRYVYVRIGGQAEAEDIAGDVFLKHLGPWDRTKSAGYRCTPGFSPSVTILSSTILKDEKPKDDFHR